MMEGRVPPELLASFHREIYDAFLGWTDGAEVVGAWRMADGSQQMDRSLPIVVILDEERIPLLRRMVIRFGIALGQEKMYFEISDTQVEFLDCLSTEDKSHD